MNICLIGKVPPIQGGVSRLTLETALHLGRAGHNVDIVTNADSSELGFRQLMLEDDQRYLNTLNSDRVFINNLSEFRSNSHIPGSPAYQARLFGKGLEIIEQRQIDLIIGWYLYPYGLVAAHLAKVCDKPCILLHAGSDLGRLSLNSEIKLTFKHALSCATRIIHMPVPAVESILDNLGCNLEKRVPISGVFLPDDVLQSARFGADILSLEKYRRAFFENYLSSNDAARLSEYQFEDSCETDFTLGIYGKIGEAKGTYSLLDSIKALLQRGYKLKLRQIIAGSEHEIRRYLSACVSEPLLRGNLSLLPPLPPWKVNSFIKMCDAVCFLEDGFSIPYHTPGVPLEIMAAGRAPIMYPQETSAVAGLLRGGINYLAVKRSDSGELKRVIARAAEDRETTIEIGRMAAFTLGQLKRRVSELHKDRPVFTAVKGVLDSYEKS